jgi:SAM-dependent methyltransferase
VAEIDGARTFGAGGDAYDAFMGRYAVLLAPLLADAAGVTSGQRALDVGCGTGALTGELVRRLGAEQVAGCDPAPGLLQACRARHPEVDLRAAAAEALPFADGEFDVVLAQLVMHFVSDPERAAGEMGRVVAPGGRVAACVWDFEGGMEMLRTFWDAATQADPAAPHELRTGRFGRPGELSALLGGAGLTDLAETTLTVHSAYADVDELWSTLLLGAGPAGSYTAGLTPEAQERLRSAFRERLGDPPGGFTLGAVARTVVGTRPG